MAKSISVRPWHCNSSQLILTHLEHNGSRGWAACWSSNGSSGVLGLLLLPSSTLHPRRWLVWLGGEAVVIVAFAVFCFCRAQLAIREEGYCSVGEHCSPLVMPAKNRAAWPVFGRQSVEALKVMAALTSVSSSYSGRKTKGSWMDQTLRPWSIGVRGNIIFT